MSIFTDRNMELNKYAVETLSCDSIFQIGTIPDMKTKIRRR